MNCYMTNYRMVVVNEMKLNTQVFIKINCTPVSRFIFLDQVIHSLAKKLLNH